MLDKNLDGILNIKKINKNMMKTIENDIKFLKVFYKKYHIKIYYIITIKINKFKIIKLNLLKIKLYKLYGFSIFTNYNIDE